MQLSIFGTEFGEISPPDKREQNVTTKCQNGNKTLNAFRTKISDIPINDN